MCSAHEKIRNKKPQQQQQTYAGIKRDASGSIKKKKIMPTRAICELVDFISLLKFKIFALF